MQSMTPQKEMTAGQIDQAVARFRTMLEKHAPDFPSAVVQGVLGDPEFAKAQFELLESSVKARTGLQTLTLPEPFNFDSIDEKTASNLGCTFDGYERILLTVDKPTGNQIVSITLWEENSWLSCQTLDDRYTEKGLAPNPWHLLAFIKVQPDFAGKRAIATQWKDADGNFCYAIFERWRGKLRLRVNRSDDDWVDDCLFSGSGK